VAPETSFELDPLNAVDLHAPPEILRQHFNTDGAFVIRGLFEPVQILSARSAVLGELLSAGWISDATEEAPLANMDSCCSDPDPAYLTVYDRVISQPRVHELPHGDNVCALAQKLGIEDLFLLPRIALRVIFPGTPPTPAHQDWTTVRGDRNAITVWVPLTPCHLDAGPVAVIRRSHTRGEGARLPSLGIVGNPAVPADRDRWSAASVQLGDAVVFRSLTIHGALPNTTRSLRVSMDFRLQDASQPIHPCSLLPPGRFRTWGDVCTTWDEEDRRYVNYWQENHPALVPSMADLRREFTKSDGDEKRYLERILRQVSPFA
jgi:hypothetical protein